MVGQAIIRFKSTAFTHQSLADRTPGIPASIPNFNELESMGEDYLVEAIAGEVLAQTPAGTVLSKDDLKNASRHALAELLCSGSTGS